MFRISFIAIAGSPPVSGRVQNFFHPLACEYTVMTDERIRTTHVGSLPRPERLRDLLTDPENRKTETFDAVVDEAIRKVVRKQARVGLDVANDGEQSRISYSVDTTNRLDGFGEGVVEREWPADLDDFPEYGRELLGGTENIGGPVARGPIEYAGTADLRRELERFGDAVEAEDLNFEKRFHTAPSPGAIVRFTETEYHETTEEYLFDLATALATEYGAIVEAGAVLQIDAPDVLAGHTLTYKNASTAEFRDVVATHVEAINRAVEGLPADRIRLHACWGNYPGPHHRDVALSDVIEALYEAEVGGLVIEGANPRHQHAYATFEEYPLPEEWQLVPGVIDVKTNIVEHPETVADRLERAVEVVGDPSRIVAVPDCGFGTLAWSSAVEEIAWAKLESLVEGAAIASERLG